MKIEQLISPLDNRYNNQIADLATNFSESNLNKVRFEIEIEWLIFLCSKGGKSFPSISKTSIKKLHTLKKSFDENSAKRIKSIEKKTNHDVKAVEYFIREELKKSSSLKKYEHLVHFALTSEDVNSLSYAILLRDAQIIYLKKLDVIIKEVMVVDPDAGKNTWSSSLALYPR
jgi:adenylosuccinate lyase